MYFSKIGVVRITIPSIIVAFSPPWMDSWDWSLGVMGSVVPGLLVMKLSSSS